MRKLAMWLLGSALLVAALPSMGTASGISVTGMGGTIIPTGNFGDENVIGAKVGYQVGGSLDYDLTSMFALGVDGSFNKDKGSLEGVVFDLGGGDFERVDKAQFTTLQAGVHGKYLIPVRGVFRPYVLLGLGLYRTAYKEDGTTSIGGSTTPYTLEIKSGKHFGGKLGVGGAWSLNDMWALNGEANYNVITEDKDKNFGVSSLQYVGITVGLTWKMPGSAK
jgi:hypothetical protein